MNEQGHRGHKGRWALALVCVALLALIAFISVRSRSHSHRLGIMTLDHNGTMRLGPVPLSNTNLRNAALTVVGHLNNGTISFSSTGAITISNVAQMSREMQRAGISNVIIRAGGASFKESGTN